MTKMKIQAYIYPETYAALVDISKKQGIVLSQCIDNALYYFIKNVDIKYEIEKLESRKKYKQVSETNRYYYVIKNAMNAVIDIQMSFIFLNGNANLKVATHQIKNYLELIKSFPETIRDNIKEEIEELEKMSNIEFLKERLKQNIPFRKNIGELEWKKKK